MFNNHVLCCFLVVVYIFFFSDELSFIIFVEKASYGVDDSLQGLKSIIDREDMILTVSNLCQLEKESQVTNVHLKT